MSDFPVDNQDESDEGQTLPQSGVRPNPATQDKGEDFDVETLPQSGVRPTGLAGDELPVTAPPAPAGRTHGLSAAGQSALSEAENHIGKYPIVKRLGEGGMGVVWLGHHPDLDIPVAIKTLPTHLISRDPSFIDRFIKEARTAARINHPNVVRIYDAGNDDDVYYIVMEFVDGGNVHDLITSQGGPLPINRALDIIIQCAEGLKAAAEYKIIHRDIKPENIMLDGKGTPKLADLGLAKQLDADEMSMTGTGMAVGTPSYMAPEQVQDAKTCDARADIYSLGATFYHLVTGKVPFSASSAFDMMLKHVQEPLPPPTEKNPNVPLNVEAVICMMLEKAPSLRYQSAEELLDDLNRIKFSDAPVKKLKAGQRSAPSTSLIQGAGIAAGASSQAEKAKSKRVPILIALVVLLAVVGYGIIAFVPGPWTRAKVIAQLEPKTQPETPPDVQPETPPDVEPETPPDVQPETPPDVQPETPPDVQPETFPTVPTLGKPTPLAIIAMTSHARRVNAIDMQLVPIKPGTFTMGSDTSSKSRPAHSVTLSRPFWMGSTEVTYGQFAMFVRDKGYKTTAETSGFSLVRNGDNLIRKNRIYWKNAGRSSSLPVTCVTLEDAKNFCKWLNELENTSMGYEYRLPTEAEWEYACRAGMK
ncbi:hypothetical protein BVX99_03045, partial [bacterium F16]